MRVPRSPSLSAALTVVSKEMDKAAKTAAPQEVLPAGAAQKENAVLVDAMDDGVVTRREAVAIASTLSSKPSTQARVGVLAHSSNVLFEDGARETLAGAFGLGGRAPHVGDGLSGAATAKLSKAIDDAQWDFAKLQSPVGNGDDVVPPAARWEGQKPLTTFVVNLVSDGFMTMASAQLLAKTYNLHPENKASVVALLKSTDVDFLPGTKKFLEVEFDLRNP